MDASTNGVWNEACFLCAPGQAAVDSSLSTTVASVWNKKIVHLLQTRHIAARGGAAIAPRGNL